MDIRGKWTSVKRILWLSLASFATAVPPSAASSKEVIRFSGSHLERVANHGLEVAGKAPVHDVAAVPEVEAARAPQGDRVGFSQGTRDTSFAISASRSDGNRIAAVGGNEVCPSTRGDCSSALVAGPCSQPPSFAGLDSARSAGTETCGINLAWPSATGNCGANTSLRYNVYRSTEAGFTPAPTNRIAQCATAINLADSDVMPGTRYYYIVRAEDLGAAGAGSCGGTEDSNLVQRSAIAEGLFSGLVTDDVEANSAHFAVAGTGAGSDFAVVTAWANSPSRTWFVPNPNAISDRTLTMTNAFPVTAGGPTAISFFHRYRAEADPLFWAFGYDGGVLEYSLDGGTTWTDILAAQGTVPANSGRFTMGSYTHTIYSGYGSPLGGRRAWSGGSGPNSLSTWVQTSVSLADFVGRSLQLRFRFASDSRMPDSGWWIDDIQVPAFSVCTNLSGDRLFITGFEP